MPIQGKGFFIQDLLLCEDGKPESIVKTVRSAGLRHLILKIADGAQPSGVDEVHGDYTARTVHLLRKEGIDVWGWHVVYGDDPGGEAAVAIRRANSIPVEGYVLVAGEAYQKPGRLESARRFMKDVRLGMDMPIVLQSYRFPELHPQFPWVAFLEHCDYHMPRVFWEPAHDAAWQLRESKRQCDALPHARPYLATGSAYSVKGGWYPTDDDIRTFLDTARELGINAVNFYEWGMCRRDLILLWKTIVEYEWLPAWKCGPKAGEGIG